MKTFAIARVGVSAASVAAGAVVLAFAFPRLANTGWDAMADQMAGVPVGRLLLLTLVWAAGLYIYSFVLTAALPGLKRRRALALNLGGSGIANVLPLGGAAGIGVNYAMLRSWGYDRDRVACFTVVSQVVTVVSRAMVALSGLVVLSTLPVVRRLVPLPEESTIAYVCGGVCLVAVGLRLSARVTSPAYRRLIAAAVSSCRQTVALVRQQWLPIAAGSVGYAALQLCLFELCFNAVHAQLSIGLVAAGYAVDRLLSLVPITPGGVGVVEAGVTAVLVALGGPATAVATGVLLFRAFSYFAEIPIGGAVVIGWLAQNSMRSHARVDA
jgi:uncharacterized membrane protein YbhN (UPF0104 family)